MNGVLGKSDLSILYPPPYERPVYFNEKADAELIGWAMSEFD